MQLLQCAWGWFFGLATWGAMGGAIASIETDLTADFNAVWEYVLEQVGLVRSDLEAFKSLAQKSGRSKLLKGEKVEAKSA